MSQSDVLQLLKNLGGCASSSEIIQEAKKEFPERSLHSHVSMRLKALKRRGLVSKQDTEDGLMWKITSKGENRTLNDYSLSESLYDECLSLLKTRGIEIVNIVATVDTGENIDLYEIDMTFSNVIYHPETDSHLTYIPKENDRIKLRIPSSGRITIVGCENKEEVIDSLNILSSELKETDSRFIFDEDEIIVQNIVGVSELDRELDLYAIASDLSSDDVEYNPETFTGLIFRPSIPGTVILFRTGKITFVGVKSCDQLLSLHEEFIQKFPVLNGGE